MIKLTEKENLLLKDLKSQEQLCVEKYTTASSKAKSEDLKNLFKNIAAIEEGHLNTINTIISGKTPSVGNKQGSQKPKFKTTFKAVSNYSAAGKKNDKYLCSDLLSTEKYVSSTYNTCVFEFAQPKLRQALNHIQKEEQMHGEWIYGYMSANGMY
ncbi:MAG: spore coat protein [Oscillospiraceae bacterium]|nr:spore coat protein [Candidatus Equicaccousia limihippi]